MKLWKDVVNYEGLYEVSNHGEIYSHYSNKILKVHLDENGYPKINLYNNGHRKSVKIHRVVALAFMDNPNNYPSINHIDEDKENNCVENLEWCTVAYNNNHGDRLAIIGRRNSKRVGQFSLDGELIKEWRSMTEASKYGFRVSGISSCCNNDKEKYKLNKTHFGYIWKFI